MRVGFVTQLLWSRFGPLWTRLVADVGAEVVLPSNVTRAAHIAQFDGIPGLAFRLAVAQTVSLGDCDLLIVPDLNPGPDLPRGGGQNPWIASFPEALQRTVSGLPPLAAVPAGPSDDLEGLVIETLFRLGRDASAVRRSWQRHRSSARPAPLRSPRWPAAPPGVHTVGMICQPWLSSDALATAVVADSPHERVRVLAQHTLDPAALRREGERLDRELIGTDLEVLGAARLFARRAGVDELTLVIDEESGADAWLGRRIDEIRKPFTTVALQDLPEPETLITPDLER